ncbi:MAG: hypothetical protein HY301_19835 [Verrucomicrobia bacterium]|nr:hypothetical protein [Verrucomicrobiota bacterium]
MSRQIQLLVVSDIHFAGDAERARGHPRAGLTRDPVKLALMTAWDRFVWLRDPLAHGPLLDRFLAEAPMADHVIANGDFSVDSANVGVSDDASLASAQECLGKLRARFGGRLLATIGDHELGKESLLGGRGGMRLASWPRTVGNLGLQPFWRVDVGRYVLLGVTSSLVGLEILRHDVLPGETAGWEALRTEHLRQVSATFASLEPGQRVLLFCHDPSALPFLLESPDVRARLGQIERTVVGHLHSGLFLGAGRILGGMPRVGFLGTTIRRWTVALNRARNWRPFRVVLCPALAGIELTRRGGFLTATINVEGREPVRFIRHILPR